MDEGLIQVQAMAARTACLRMTAQHLRPGRYPVASAMVVLFLVPYLGLSSALQPVTPIIAGTSSTNPA